MKNLAIASVAGLALAASANAQVIDISGMTYTGASSVIGSASASGVTAIQFDLSVTTFSPSWGSEVNLDISGPGGFLFTADGSDFDTLGDDGPDDLTFGWGDSTGTFSFSGTASGLSGGSGTYTVSAFDSFDDSGDDGVFNSGSTITLIPAPGAAALLGMGGLAATRRRR